MSAELFLDTNIFIYAVDTTDAAKREVADQLIRDTLAAGNGTTSYQVAQEFLNVVVTKARIPLGVDEARRFLDAVVLPLVQVWPSPALFHDALDTHRRWGFGFYDSLIVAAARQAGARRLLTEDLQHGQDIAGLEIHNPFLLTPS